MSLDKALELIDEEESMVSRIKRESKERIVAQLKVLNPVEVVERVCRDFDQYSVFYNSTYKHLGDEIRFDYSRRRFIVSSLPTDFRMFYEGTDFINLVGEEAQKIYDLLSGKLEEERQKMPF